MLINVFGDQIYDAFGRRRCLHPAIALLSTGERSAYGIVHCDTHHCTHAGLRQCECSMLTCRSICRREQDAKAKEAQRLQLVKKVNGSEGLHEP